MPNTIHIPTPLRPFTDKQESVDVNGGTVGELLADLTKKYEGLRKHLYAEDGRLRNFVVQIDVHEVPQLAVVGIEMLAEAVVFRRQVGQQFADGGAADFHGFFLFGERDAAGSGC